MKQQNQNQSFFFSKPILDSEQNEESGGFLNFIRLSKNKNSYI